MGELDGKVCLVTGATQAMGETIARRLASDGATVVGVGRSEQRGWAVSDRLAADGYRADFIATDVGQEEQVAYAVDMTVRRFGGLDIVVNNAASLDTSTSESPVHLEPTEVFDSIMKVALRSGRMINRFGNPEDTAAAVGFLASGGAGYVTGTTLNVDGGLLAKAPVVRVAQRLAESVDGRSAVGDAPAGPVRVGG